MGHPVDCGCVLLPSANQREIFEDFIWEVTCNGIHNIFITDNFSSLTSKGATLTKSTYQFPVITFVPVNIFLPVIFDKNVF